MKIVIEIPEEMIISLEQGSFGAKYNMYDIVGCVMNGTPLPKGHGKLKDVDALYDSAKLCHTEEDGTACVEWREINDAPTIIEGSDNE